MITESGTSEVSVDQQDIPSLTDEQLEQLGQLGIQVETFYRQPMDIEWGIVDGKFVLLQARPITTQTQAHVPKDQKDGEIAKLREAEIQILKTIADANGTVWSHHNLAEVFICPVADDLGNYQKIYVGCRWIRQSISRLGVLSK